MKKILLPLLALILVFGTGIFVSQASPASAVGPVWSIEKTSSDTDLTLATGQTYLVDYEVTVTNVVQNASLSCVDVHDDMYGFLGQVCEDEISATFQYSMEIGPYEVCGEYTVENTAWFEETFYGDTGADSHIITVTVVGCQDGCTLTPGYWKTHSKYGPAPYDDTWAQLGEDTPFFSTPYSYYQVLWNPPKGGNAYYILAQAYIAAQLNNLNGASPGDAEEAFAQAIDLLEAYTPEDGDVVMKKSSTRALFLELAQILDDYNNGYIGPGHCDE
ncbi:hypothetical protein ACFLVN_01665 [Chloroflexota bacterium]